MVDRRQDNWIGLWTDLPYVKFIYWFSIVVKSVYEKKPNKQKNQPNRLKTKLMNLQTVIKNMFYWYAHKSHQTMSECEACSGWPEFQETVYRPREQVINLQGEDSNSLLRGLFK